MLRTSAVALIVALVTAGCGSKSEGDGSGAGTAGKERGECRPDRTCDPGLLCLSGLCVRPPPADCGQVGELLTSFDLGNYAEPEQRAPLVARYRGDCERAHVTKDEGECLMKTRDKWSAAQCAPALFPELASGKTGDCGAIAEKMKGLIEKQPSYQQSPQMKQYFDAVIPVIRASCEEDHWPEALKKCALASNLERNPLDLQVCNAQMPVGLSQKMQQRMVAAMQAVKP